MVLAVRHAHRDERRRRPTDPADDPAARAGITVLHRPTEDPAHPQMILTVRGMGYKWSVTP